MFISTRALMQTFMGIFFFCFCSQFSFLESHFFFLLWYSEIFVIISVVAEENLHVNRNRNRKSGTRETHRSSADHLENTFLWSLNLLNFAIVWLLNHFKFLLLYWSLFQILKLCGKYTISLKMFHVSPELSVREIVKVKPSFAQIFVFPSGQMHKDFLRW